MAETIYALCALTSMACTWLLTRTWRRRREPLLIWSAVCFAGLALNNCFLIVDLVLVPQIDLTTWRNATALAAVGSLLVGLIWEIG
jgi:hypothetical protein